MSDRKVDSSKLIVDSGVAVATPAPQSSTADDQLHASPGRRAWLRFKKNRPAVLSAWFLLLLLAAILAWPVLLKLTGGTFAKTHNPDWVSDSQFAKPGAQHW